MSKRKFIFLHYMMCFSLFTIIFAPLAYFVLIPAILRHKIQTLDLNQVNIDYMDVKEWRPDGMKFAWKAVMPKPFFISMKTRISALNLTIHDDHANSLMKVSLPEVVIDIGKPIVLEFEGEVFFEEETGLKDLIARISQPGGMPETVFTADTRITINMWGVTWYKNLAIKRTIKSPKLDGNLTTLLDIMPSFIMDKGLLQVTAGENTETVDIGGVNVTDVHKPLIINGTQFWQILPKAPPVNLKSLDVILTDAGPNIILKVLMQNPTVVSVPLPDTSIGLQLEGSYLSTANIKGFNLTRGLNDLELNLQLTFDPNRIVSPDQLSNSIAEAAAKLFGVDQEGLKFNVIGPIDLKNVNVIKDITEKLSLILPVDDIVKNTNVQLLRNLFETRGIASLLHLIHFNIRVSGNQFIIPIEIDLPSFLPLPPSFEFNYNTSFGIFKDEQNIFTIGISGISMTNNNDTLRIQTTTTILLNNTLEAATALASAINPALLGQVSSIDVKNLKIVDEKGESFPWVDQLFGNLTIHLPIPGFNTTTIVNMVTQNGTSIPADIVGMDLTQRSDVAGFDVNGTVVIEYPPTLPIITIDTGYVESTISINDSLLTTAKLPNGIKYTTGDNLTNIVASAILNKDDGLKSIIGDLVMGFLGTEDDIEMPMIGISGIKMGTSEAQSFVTFSKVVVPIDLVTLRPAIKTTIETISQSIQQQTGLLSLTGIDFAITSSNSLSIGVQSNLNNPTNITASIGSVSLTTTLLYGELANITISPIQLLTGKSPLNLQMKIDIVNGENGMSDNILQLVKDLSSTEGDFKSIIGVKGLTLFPPPTKGGNSNDTLATIDQFSTAHITVPSPIFPAENLRIDFTEMIKNPQNGIIDISGILPTLETVFALPSLTSVSIETKENSRLQVRSALNYTNPLPISAKIPFFGATIILDGNDLVTFGISQIDLARNEGSMDVALSMAFDNSDGTKSAVNEFFKNLLNGEIKQKIEIGGIYFGGANETENDLLSSLKLPVPTDLIDVNAIKDKIIELSPIKLPISLDQALSSPFLPQLQSVDITTSSNRVLSLQVGAKLNVPFEIKADIGYFGINGITLDDTQFTSVEIFGIKTEGAGINSVSLGIQLTFNNEESIPRSVKSIYDSLVNGDFISTKGGVNGISLGISKEDSIHTFDQISLSTEIGNLITGQLDLNGMIDSILTDIGNNNNSTLISVEQGSISINIPNLLQMVISQLGIKFLPGKVIEARITSSITLPFSLTMNIGFAGVGIFLDDLPTLDILLATTSEGSSVSIVTSITIKDSDELTNKLGELTQDFFNESPLQGNLAIRNPIIGVSSDDNINAFSLISLELSLEKLVAPLVKNLPKTIDPFALLGQLGFQLDALEIASTVQHTILANVRASFNNNFPVTIELGFIELSLGLDSTDILDASVSDLSIGSGANNGLSIVTSLIFKVFDDQVQDKVASFVSSLQQNGLGGTSEFFSITGIKIGVSPDDHIKALEKVFVGIPSSSILNQQVVEKLLGMVGLSLTDLTIGGMLNRLDVDNIVVEMDPNGQELVINGDVGINNISLPLSVDMGILELSVALNAAPLTRVILPDIKIVSSNNVISTKFTAALIFQDSDELQDEVAALAKSLIEGTKDTVIPGNANINGLLFGNSNSDRDIIDTFRKVLISLPLNPILQPIKAMITTVITGFMDGTGNVKLALDDVTLGIKNSNTLTTDVVADLTGLPKITVNIPFASVDVSMNNQAFVTTVVNGMKFEGGRFTTSIEMIFQDNKPLANELAVVGADLVFRRLTYTVSLQVGISNLIFGPSPQKTFGFTRKISIAMDVGKFVNDFSEFNEKNNLLFIDNIQSEITQEGIDATFTVPAIPNLPLNVNIPSLLANLFFKGVSGSIIKAVGLPNVQKGQSKWEFGLLLRTENGPMAQALETAVPNLLQFKSFSEGASLGAVTICNTKDCLNPPDDSFNIFNEISFSAPPLVLWNPITVELNKILPTIGLEASFENIGPLHADIGDFVMSLESSGTSIFEIFSAQPVIIQNNLENSGQNVIPIEAKLTLDPLEIPKLLLDLVDFEKDFVIALRVNRGGDQVEWLNELLKGLPDTVMKNLLPILRALLDNIKLGIDLNSNDKNGNGTVIDVGDGKNGTAPPTEDDNPSKAPPSEQPDAKEPQQEEPKQPKQPEDGKTPEDDTPDNGKTPENNTPENGKTPENNTPENGKTPTPEKEKTPSDTEEEEPSVGKKILDVITKPFKPDLVEEKVNNVKSKPILRWIIH